MHVVIYSPTVKQKEQLSEAAVTVECHLMNDLTCNKGRNEGDAETRGLSFFKIRGKKYENISQNDNHCRDFMRLWMLHR